MSHKHRSHSRGGGVGLVLAKLALELGAAVIKKKLTDRDASAAIRHPVKPETSTTKIRRR